MIPFRRRWPMGMHRRQRRTVEPGAASPEQEIQRITPLPPPPYLGLSPKNTFDVLLAVSAGADAQRQKSAQILVLFFGANADFTSYYADFWRFLFKAFLVLIFLRQKNNGARIYTFPISALEISFFSNI